MTPDLAERKRIAEAATPFEDADQLSVLKAYIGATPPSVVLALITRIEALEAGLKPILQADADGALWDGIDNHGKPYQSAALALALKKLRAIGDRHD